MKQPLPRPLISLSLAALLALLPFAAHAQQQQQRKLDPTGSPLACARYFIGRLDPENDSSTREDSLVRLAFQYLESGKPEEAWRAFDQLPCDSLVNYADRFAAESIKYGRRDFALRFLERGLACIEADEDFDRSMGLFNDYIDQLLALHQDARALAVAEMMDDKSTAKANAYVQLAQAAVAAERPARALELLERAFAQAQEGDDSRDSRLNVLAKTGAGFARLGNPERAAEVLAFALQLGGEDFEPTHVKHRFASMYEWAGQREQALSLIAAEASDDIDTLIDGAFLYVRLGEKAMAYELLARALLRVEVADDGSRKFDIDLKFISWLYLRADDPERALHIANKIDDGYESMHASLDIADWFLKQKQSESALLALDAAAAKVKLVVSERPEEILPHMSTSKALEKARQLSDLAEKYLEAKAYDRAEAAVMAIDLPQRRAAKLAQVAGAMSAPATRARAEKLLDKALSLSDKAEEYGHDELREAALPAIAQGYARIGKREMSQEVFARALEIIRALEGSNRLERLTMLGWAYERSGLKTNKQIQDVLRGIVAEWSEED